MKRIKFVLFFLVVILVVKFSTENLSETSFFLKIGCQSNSEEYSLFLEAGQRSDQPRRYSIPLYHSYAESQSVMIQGLKIENPKESVQPANGSHFEDEDQNEFALVIAELSQMSKPETHSFEQIDYLEEDQSIALGEYLAEELDPFHLVVATEAISQYSDCDAEGISEFDLAFGDDFPLEQLMPPITIEFAPLDGPEEMLSIAIGEENVEELAPYTLVEVACEAQVLAEYETEDMSEFQFTFTDEYVFEESRAIVIEFPPLDGPEEMFSMAIDEENIEELAPHIVAEVACEGQAFTEFEAEGMSEFVLAGGDPVDSELTFGEDSDKPILIWDLIMPSEDFQSLAFDEWIIEEFEAPTHFMTPVKDQKVYLRGKVQLEEPSAFDLAIVEGFEMIPIPVSGAAEADSVAMPPEDFTPLATDTYVGNESEVLIGHIKRDPQEEIGRELENWITHFEAGEFHQEPNTAQELAAADWELQKIETDILMAIAYAEKEREEKAKMTSVSPSDFESNRDVGLGEMQVEELEELRLERGLTAAEIKQIENEMTRLSSEFEKGADRDVPNTEAEFAAAVSQVEEEGQPVEEEKPQIAAQPIPVKPVEEAKPQPTQVAVQPILEQPAEKLPALNRYEQSVDSNVLSKPPVCCIASQDCSLNFWPKQLSVRHVWGDQENDCIPFASNYTTVELLFASDYRLGKVMPLVDLRGHRFDNNTYAANIGIGGRYIPNPACDRFCELLGFNAYYDYRQGCIGYYNQVGVGIEVLGRYVDLRANAYAPFGKKRHINTCVFDDYIGDYYAIRQSIESISYSFNAEIGFYLLPENCTNFTLYAALGPYFIARAKCDDGVVGAEARLRPQYKDYVALDLSWRYDRLFETIWQVEIVFNLPLYQISGQNKYPCCISDRQIYQPIQRFEVMPLSKRTCWHTNF